MTAGIVGLGLIGGSFAKAYHEAGHRVLAFDTDQSVFDFAVLSGAVDGLLSEESLSSCDLILIAVYPSAAVDYLREVITLMGVENVTFSAVQKGEATIIRLDGEKLGALIGRRGETMESLSYLASLVANRLEGDYIKLGLDVAGYRDKRESDLTALAQRIGAKVRKTGRSFAMEPMNPYERRIIHSAISKMEGVRSESKGEGRDRRVVIYSTAPDAQTENTYGERRGRGGNRNGRRPGGNRNGGYRGERRSENGGRNGGYRGNRSGAPRGPRPSSVPERTYAPRDAESAAPVAPKRTERVDDFADFSFGKIEL